MPYPYRCLSRKCKETMLASEIQYFEEHERGIPLEPACKNCGKTDKLHRLSVIHLLVPAADGTEYDIKRSFGDHNWNFACPTASAKYKEAKDILYTAAKEATTCHDCLEAVKSGKVKLEYYEE